MIHVHIPGYIHHVFGDFTMNIFYGFFAIAGAGVAVTNTGGTHPYIEYGALALCGFMVAFLCHHLSEKEKAHSEERKELVRALTKSNDLYQEMSSKAITAYNRLAELLADRPCLYKDHRIKEGD